MCAGVCWCVLVCACVQVCTVVQVCAGVCRCVQVCAKVGVSFFVFARDEMKSNSVEHFLLQNNTRPKLTSCLSSRQAGETAILLDILRRRSVTVSPRSTRQLQHRRSHCSGHRTRQDGTSPETPGSLCTFAYQGCLSSCLGPGQLGDKTAHLVRPQAPNFNGKQNKTGSAEMSQKLCVHPLLLAPSFPKRNTIHLSSSPSGRAICPQGTDECCIYGHLCASKKKTVSHYFQSSAVCHPTLGQVKISDHDVRGNSPPCFSANPCHNALQRPSSTSPHTCPRARCTVVATRVKWTAKPAGTRRQGKGKAKLAKKDHAEMLGRELGEPARGTS